MTHFLLRLHAWREGRAKYVERDIALSLERELGVLSIGDYPVPWLTFYVSAVLEKAFVPKAIGKEIKAGDVIERIRQIIRSRDYSSLGRYPTYASSFELEELFRVGDVLAEELFAIAKKIDAAAQSGEKYSNAPLSDFAHRILNADYARYWGMIPRR